MYVLQINLCIYNKLCISICIYIYTYEYIYINIHIFIYIYIYTGLILYFRLIIGFLNGYARMMSSDSCAKVRTRYTFFTYICLYICIIINIYITYT
jgi:hypothetical protein